MLLLPDAQLATRKRLTRDGDLGALYDSLSAELNPLLERDLYIPEQKALLSRAGGRCEKDGTALEFDPFSPQRHRCPQCGTFFAGELHHRAWVMQYQLWLAERAVHAALFYALRGEEMHRRLATDILDGYAARYIKYPNIDNVLGPGRVFFSTYLESIWLLQICTAVDLLRAAGDATMLPRIAEKIIEPSSETIAQFDEGMSNRHVWNNAALLAADTLLGNDLEFDARLYRHSSSLVSHLKNALLPDGTWYEGENYHQFGLRGLWFGVTIAESRGASIPDALVGRFNRAFEALYVTALPDFTMPSRKDSQYAVSLRQWRIAEMAELGFARSASQTLASALARTYESGHPRVETGRARSTADAERNSAGGALTRADLGWRALLHAVPLLTPASPRQPQSALLEGQGLAIFRRSPDTYASLDYGTYGGGHGHPDRLNVNLSVGQTRVLDDLGTGSYVDPSLHWYRSTLAHNAPLVNGRSQPESDGTLVAHDERGALGWTVASVHWPGSGVRIERALVVAPDYLVDELRWEADANARVELPWHVGGACDFEFTAAPLDGENGIEDGFEFVRDTECAPLRAGELVRISDDHSLWLTSDVDADLFRGSAPGQPASQPRPFYLIRTRGRSGRFRAVLAWSHVIGVAFGDAGPELSFADGTRHQHRRDGQGWHVELFALNARSSVDLGGFRVDKTVPAASASERTPVLLSQTPVTFELGERHYRRSEQSWREAGEPRATVAVSATADTLRLDLEIHAGDKRFVPPGARNDYDNEHADTMGAGVQLYVRRSDEKSAWMLVPEPGGRVRLRAIQGWTESRAEPDARWRDEGVGYAMTITLPLSGAGTIDLDLLINETTADRERRRGQLVLSGAEGEFVYLRDDRHDPDRMFAFQIMP